MKKQIINIEVNSLEDFENRGLDLDEKTMDLIMSPSDGMDLPTIEIRVELLDPKNFSMSDVLCIEHTDFGLTVEVVVTNYWNRIE